MFVYMQVVIDCITQLKKIVKLNLDIIKILMYVYVEFSYNQDLNVCIFCVVKVKEIGCFLMVCSSGNSICDEENDIRVVFLMSLILL